MWSNRPAAAASNPPAAVGGEGSSSSVGSGLSRVEAAAPEPSAGGSVRLPLPPQIHKCSDSTDSAISLAEGSSPMSATCRLTVQPPVTWPTPNSSPGPSPGPSPQGEGEGPLAFGEALKEKPKKYITQYELGRTLGKGSYAKVKICFDTEDEKRPYAIKIFNKSLLKRRRMWSSAEKSYKTAFDDVLREIAIMRKLRHENVMALRDVIDDASINKLYMVMAYCKRGAIMDSHKINPSTEPLQSDDCRRWFTDAVAGLDYLHYQDIVHFDLKPDNILIADDNRAVIADFGVSRTILSDLAEEGGDAGLTVGSPGTPSYTAPEVWGQGKYEPRGADVWALGVTLHAMAFGTLPFFSVDQQQLIEMVTSPAEWECAQQSEDASLLDLLHGVLRKRPEERMSLGAVKQHTYVRRELGRRADVEYEQITVSEEELRKAVITGHIENFRRTKRGTLHKTTLREEYEMYTKLADKLDYLPKLIDVKETLGKRVIIEMQDLTHGVQGPCLMDLKMGQRTFMEEDATDDKIRPDLLEKMLKVQLDAATDEERRAGGISKMRYLQFRETTSSTSTLGFRVDAIRLADGVDANCPDAQALKKITTEERVGEAVLQYVQGRLVLLQSFLKSLLQLRTALEACDAFLTHAFIRTSLLLIYSDATNNTSLHMIDLSRAYPAGCRLSHRVAWEAGNHEDGYLTGLDNLIRILERLVHRRAQQQAAQLRDSAPPPRLGPAAAGSSGSLPPPPMWSNRPRPRNASSAASSAAGSSSVHTPGPGEPGGPPPPLWSNRPR